MRNERIKAAATVKREFELAEGAADMAATQAAKTIAYFIEQRAHLKLPLNFGIDAIDDMANGLKFALQSRRAYVEAHAKLASLPAKMGIEKAFGPACPPNEVFAPFRLSLVEEQAQAA